MIIATSLDGSPAKSGTKTMTAFTRITLIAALALLPALHATAQTQSEAPVTPATHHHGLPNNNPAFNGGSANPRGEGRNGGGNIHGIANVPGQNADNHPSQGEPGFRDQIGTVHGGLGHMNH